MLWIILATLLFQMETEADIETGTVVIDVVGLESDQGQVVAVLFSQGEWGFPPNPNQAGFSSSSEISDLAVHLELFDHRPAFFRCAFQLEQKDRVSKFEQASKQLGPQERALLLGLLEQKMKSSEF